MIKKYGLLLYPLTKIGLFNELCYIKTIKAYYGLSIDIKLIQRYFY